MADLTPEQLERLAYLAAIRDDIDKRMSEYAASLGEDSSNDPEQSIESFSMDAEMLRAVSLEFMEHATALVQEVRNARAN